MKRVLITGGSGFIGTNLINYLRFASPNSALLNLDIAKPRDSSHAQFYRFCDINNLASLQSAVDDFQPSHVFHLAAVTGIGDLPLSHFETNIYGVKNVVQSLKSCPSVKRVVFASSLLVCKVGYVPESFDEYIPTTPYGISKMKGELVVKSLASGLDWVIVRPISIWGPWNSEPYRQFFHSVLRGYYFNIGNFQSLRSLGFVGNTVFQLCSIAEAPVSLVSSKLFYLADYEPLSLRKMAFKIAKYRSFFSCIPTLPLFLVKILAFLGDFLVVKCRLAFPLTTFRLNNLLVEYVFDLSSLSDVCGPLPYSSDDGIRLTIQSLHSD